MYIWMEISIIFEYIYPVYHMHWKTWTKIGDNNILSHSSLNIESCLGVDVKLTRLEYWISCSL